MNLTENRMTRKMKIMSSAALLGIAATAVGAALVVPAIASETSEQDVALNIQEAGEIALRAAPGRIIESELENEDGVMVYSFEIQQADTVREVEVEVDANSGAIIENSIENDDGDENDNDADEVEEVEAEVIQD